MFLTNLCRTGFFVVRFFAAQKQYNKAFIGLFFQPFYEKWGRSLSAATLKKITQYYCLGIPITCASYKKIYGGSLSTNERSLATLAAIITPLIDDFTDEKTLSHAQIESLTAQPHNYTARTLEEDIVKHILCELLAAVPSPQGFQYALQRTMAAQRLSENQMATLPLTEKELWHITIEKGAWSNIFFHYVLTEIPTPECIAVLHQMGGMLQMCNDIFDVHKDFTDGIQTPPNTCANYGAFEAQYLRGCRQFCHLAQQLPYPKHHLAIFITFMASVMARGMVALQMLKKLQRAQGGGPLSFPALQRHQLICDMEKPANLLRTIKYTWEIVR